MSVTAKVVTNKQKIIFILGNSQYKKKDFWTKAKFLFNDSRTTYDRTLHDMRKENLLLEVQDRIQLSKEGLGILEYIKSLIRLNSSL